MADKVWWHVYMIKIEGRSRNHKRFGNSTEHYTGITSRGIAKRFKEHLLGCGNGYIQRNWPDARKMPIYVEYLYGTRWEANQREKQIKKYCVKKKKELIASDKNMLVSYVPIKRIVLKKNGGDGEMVIRIE